MVLAGTSASLVVRAPGALCWPLVGVPLTLLAVHGTRGLGVHRAAPAFKRGTLSSFLPFVGLEGDQETQLDAVFVKCNVCVDFE